MWDEFERLRKVGRMSNTSTSDEDTLKEIEEQTGVSYNPDTGTVEFTKNRHDTAQYEEFIRYMFENEYIDEDDLPLSAEQAQKRYLINSSPSHQHRDMVRPREVVEGVYMETNHDSSSKARYAANFIEDFLLDE